MKIFNYSRKNFEITYDFNFKIIRVYVDGVVTSRRYDILLPVVKGKNFKRKFKLSSYARMLNYETEYKEFMNRFNFFTTEGVKKLDEDYKKSALLETEKNKYKFFYKEPTLGEDICIEVGVNNEIFKITSSRSVYYKNQRINENSKNICISLLEAMTTGYVFKKATDELWWKEYGERILETIKNIAGWENKKYKIEFID